MTGTQSSAQTCMAPALAVWTQAKVELKYAQEQIQTMNAKVSTQPLRDHAGRH